MSRIATLIGSALLVLLTALGFGCGPNSVGMGSPMPTMVTNAAQTAVSQPSQRAARVAATSACAQAYGYSHDATKLRTSYLAYETQQGATRAQLADIEKSYDAAIAEWSGRSCSGRDSNEVVADLRRYLSGYFTERAAPPKPAFNEKGFWVDDSWTQLR